MLSWQQHVKPRPEQQEARPLLLEPRLLGLENNKNRLLEKLQTKNVDIPLLILAKMNLAVLNPEDDRGYKTLHYIHSRLTPQQSPMRLWHEYEAQSKLFIARKEDFGADYFARSSCVG